MEEIENISDGLEFFEIIFSIDFLISVSFVVFSIYLLYIFFKLNFSSDEYEEFRYKEFGGADGENVGEYIKFRKFWGNVFICAVFLISAAVYSVIFALRLNPELIRWHFAY